MQNIICGFDYVQNLQQKNEKNRAKNLQKGIFCVYIRVMN
jgi:hypothetical protein